MKLIPIRHKPNLFKHSVTGIIYFRQYKAPYGQIKKSTGETTIAKAEIVAEEIKQRLFHEKPDKIEKKLIEDEWKDFLKINETKSKRTHESMELQGRLHLLPFFGGMFPLEITEAVWESYIAHAYKTTPGRKLFNDRKYFSMFFYFLHRADKIKKVPKFRNPDPETKVGKVYSDKEITALISEAQADLKLQIMMAVTMGMRLSEILLLSWERVDMDKKVIHLRAQDTKIRKARSFAISEPVYDLLKAHQNDSQWVFPSPVDNTKPVHRQGNKTAWTACRRRAKVRGRFHDLRHTFLTKAFKNSVNPAIICHYAGLSLEEAQRTYLHFDAEDTRGVASLVEVGK